MTLREKILKAIQYARDRAKMGDPAGVAAAVNALGDAMEWMLDEQVETGDILAAVDEAVCDDPDASPRPKAPA